MPDTVGQADIRGLNVNRVVTGFALQSFIMKPLLRVTGSSKWQERYYAETAADLTAVSPMVIEGVPRLANFPHLSTSWTQKNSYHKKHAGETVISWEDAISNDIPVIERSLLRIGRAIAKSVDDDVYQQFTTGSYDDILSGAASAAWANGAANPVNDVSEAVRAIWSNNYDANSAVLLLNPHSYRDLLRKVIGSGASWQAVAGEKLMNGTVGQFLGLRVIVSNSVTASGATVMIPNETGNYLELESMQTQTIPDPGIKYTIRSWEIGLVQVTNPKAVYQITSV